VIGREKDCQLAIDSPILARHHCMLLWDGSTLIVHWKEKTKANPSGGFTPSTMSQLGQR
jgi:pSer/pThr/pTyr-binding forkhead associated (FHA) protein